VNKLRDKQPEEPGMPEGKDASRPSARLPKGFISLLNGSFLTREMVLGNMPFILFCAGLMILYISYGYSTERTVRDLHTTDAELKELRSEYITMRARLEKQEQQSQVAAGIGALGLRESRVPPIKLTVGRKEIERTRQQ
jgi:hypothetical protein